MFSKVTHHDWESLVQKQLKTDDIYSVLSKENIEGISVKPYYDAVSKPLINLPKVEESTHLVSVYHDDLLENVFAFLLNENIEELSEKVLFVNNLSTAKQLTLQPDCQYFSLIDVFDNNTGSLNEALATQLLEKNFTRSICIDISLHQNAGAALYQQLGIALAKAKELVEHYGNSILGKLIFRMSIGSNYFFEIAKIRALKLIFNQLSREYGGNEVPYIFAETSFRNKAKNDVENNLIRSTLELASAMVGGADAVFSNDYKIENPTQLSEEISFKQQIVLAYESIINVFDDALNGSYYVEDITRQIAEKSWAYFLEIEDAGGFTTNLKSGKLQNDIYNQAVAEQRWVEEGRIKLIGVNMYPKLNITKSAEEMYSAQVIKPVRLAEMFE